MRLRAGFRTDRGCVKQTNEDALGIAGLVARNHRGPAVEAHVPLDRGVVALVADGMGGHAAGRRASEIAACALMADERLVGGDEAVAAALDSAQTELYRAARADPQLSGLGSTVVGLAFGGNGTATAFNVGDSRLLVATGEGDVLQLSVDHTRPDPGGGRVLTQCLGGHASPRPFQAHIRTVAATPGDRFLLCSDGLTDLVTNDELAGALALPPPLSAIADALVEAALRRGAPDNVTALVLELDGAHAS